MLAKVETLTEENQKAQEEVKNIREKFAKHDLTVLSLKKPKLIEKIINKGTKDVLNELESITTVSNS
jgi:DNA-binding MarR family transcriptional regulator